MWRFRVVIRILLILLPVSAIAEASRIGIPQRPDPPFAIDGDLADWASVPSIIEYSNQDQVVYGASTWKSQEDLSAKAQMAWRGEHLFIAASVTDDRLSQNQHGETIWRGDHIELYLDTRPDLDSGGDSFGEGQYQLAFSPGNFDQSGDPLTGSDPQVFCYRPTGHVLEDVSVASKRTENGWTIEAAIPWRGLNVKQPVIGTPLRFELAISDSDSDDPRQECLMTLSTETWGHVRSRLTPAVLAGADGVPPASISRVEIASEFRIPRDGKETVEFECAPTPSGKISVLSLKARLQFDTVAGYTAALRLSLNDTLIGAERLMNKPPRVKSRGGHIYSMAAAETFNVFYSPDFTSPDFDPYYGLLDGVRPCEFEFNIAGLLKDGSNVLVIEHAAPSIERDLVVADLMSGFREPPPPPQGKAGPPSGPLTLYEPRVDMKIGYELREEPDTRIEVSLGGETFVVESQFSTPTPEWVRSSCPHFSLKRRVEQLPEAVRVYDTITNMTDKNLPIMRRNQIVLGDRLKKVWLAGLEQYGQTATQASPANPTTFAVVETVGIGLLPLDDVSRIHVLNYATNGTVGLADNNLVLPPAATYTAEWAIVPTEEPDYWSFINAARRLIDANFTIDGGFAFLRADYLTEPWTDDQLTDFIRFKDAHYVCASLTYPRYEGRYCHGTSFQLVSRDGFRSSFERWRRLVPESEYLFYFHCFIDVTDDGPERFKEARVLQPDGTQVDYGEPYDRIYLPTEANLYGQEVRKNVHLIFDDIGADGVYWDEHQYSRCLYHYGDPWDGFSGDIDSKTMTVNRLKSSVTLLTESWRLDIAKRILAQGPLIGNGPPFTRAMAALKFPCFVETGSISFCVQSHLHSPIALGDHLTERSETDAYRHMLAALDYGCVYHWYNDLTVIPTHPHLTRYMYPITPMELHNGFIIGRERIITRVSGLFGWGDASSHKVHLFDDSGREVESHQAPLVSRDGKNYTEVRLPEDWSAAIVKE
jgi:hypothetical protein